MITIHDVEQGTPEWLAMRAKYYTGSGAHKLLRSEGEVKMVNGVVTPYSQSEITGFKGNFWTKRGHILEEEAISLYEAIKHVVVPRPGFVTNSNYPMCGYSPDGLCDDMLIEVKCFKEDKHLAMFNGDIPVTVKSQIHFGLLITERPAARLLIYNPDLDARHALKIIDIPRNENIQTNFKRKLLRSPAHVNN